MSLKLELYFHRSTNTGALSLEQTCFCNNSGNRIEVDAEGMCLPESPSFRWTKAVRVFCVLILRAFSCDDPLAFALEEWDLESAKTLSEVIRLAHAKDRPTVATDIQRIFGWPPGRPLPPSLFNKVYNAE